MKKQIIIWCVGAIIYFIAIFVPVAIYYRTNGNPPDILLALHHEFFFLPIFAAMIGRDFCMLSQMGQEIVAFVVGIIFYSGIGLLIGLLRVYRREKKHLRGLYYAILLSMLGYTIGAWIDGEPPLFLLLNPPLFLIGGYIFGISTFQSQRQKRAS